MPLLLVKNPSSSPLTETENAAVLIHFIIQLTNISEYSIALKVSSIRDQLTVSKALEISSLIADRDETESLW